MSKAGAIVKLVCVVALTLVSLAVLNETRLFIRQSRAAVSILAAEVSASGATVQAAAEQARLAAEQGKLAAIEQRAYWSKTSLETYKTMAALRLTIIRTNRTLNDVLGPQLAANLQHADELTRHASEQLQRTMTELEPTLKDLARASAAAADTIADPHIRQTLAHVDETSASLAGTSAHVEVATGMIEEKVRQLTKPASFLVRVGKTLLSLAAQFGQVAAGFFK